MQVIATKSIHIIIQELMNLLHGIGFLPGRISSLTLLVLMSSVLTNYVSVHVCTGAGRRSTCSGTMKLNRFCSWEVYIIASTFDVY